MAEFMETLRREQGRDPGSVEMFLSSHPAPAERAAALRRSLGTRASGRRDSAAFRAARARALRLTPPPRSMQAIAVRLSADSTHLRKLRDYGGQAPKR